MLSLVERRREIVRLTDSNQRVDVAALAHRFDVSAVTIRNDLNALSAKGLIVRSRGGAIPSTRLTRELSVQEKYAKNLGVKRRLGQAVADLIGDDVRSVILDSGTTTEQVAQCLVGRPGLSVLTNGLNIATALAASEGIEVRVTGGTLRKTSMSFYGRHAEESLRLLRFDALVLGADGVDARFGATTHFEPEAGLNRMMCRAARRVILVADSSKFEQRGLHIICAFSEVDAFVTDAGIPDEARRTLADLGVEVHVVGLPV